MNAAINKDASTIQDAAPKKPTADQWTLPERELCLEGLQRYGEDMAKIATLVGTKSMLQVEQYLQARCLTKMGHGRVSTAKGQGRRSIGREAGSPTLSASQSTRTTQHPPARPAFGSGIPPGHAASSWAAPCSLDWAEHILPQAPTTPYELENMLPAGTDPWLGDHASPAWGFADLGSGVHPLLPAATSSLPPPLNYPELPSPAQHGAKASYPPRALGPVTPPLGRHACLPKYINPAPLAPEASCSRQPLTLSSSDVVREEPFQRPDFGVVYAYLGSLFDDRLKSQSLVKHEALLKDLGPSEQSTLRHFLQNLTSGLSDPDFVQKLRQELQFTGYGAMAPSHPTHQI